MSESLNSFDSPERPPQLTQLLNYEWVFELFWQPRTATSAHTVPELWVSLWTLLTAQDGHLSSHSSWTMSESLNSFDSCLYTPWAAACSTWFCQARRHTLWWLLFIIILIPECMCDWHGTLRRSKECDKNISQPCSCRPAYQGQFCERCAPGYYRTAPYFPCHRCPCAHHATRDAACKFGECSEVIHHSFYLMADPQIFGHEKPTVFLLRTEITKDIFANARWALDKSEKLY